MSKPPTQKIFNRIGNQMQGRENRLQSRMTSEYGARERGEAVEHNHFSDLLPFSFLAGTGTRREVHSFPKSCNYSVTNLGFTLAKNHAPSQVFGKRGVLELGGRGTE